MKKKVLITFGTRPEAIKMAPVVKQLQSNKAIETIVCVTAQHRQMLDQVLAIFDIKPDYDLDLMRQNQTLAELTASILKNTYDTFSKINPDLVLVHGDTTTAFASSLSAFYHKIPVGHVEAGLRTHNKYSPWPEEINRKIIGTIADLHFAPTAQSQQNLLQESVPSNKIFITGNTVIDALLFMNNKIDADKNLKSSFDTKFKFLDSTKKMILITGHRRENFGNSFEQICNALLKIAQEHNDVELVYPVHLNPNVQEPVRRILNHPKKEIANRIHLIDPLDYESFVYLMKRSYLILTDSGGIQEEAPSLKKPVLVLRDTTERPEAIDAGVVRLAGTSEKDIFNMTSLLLSSKEEYDRMISANNPYGDGTAAKKIDSAILKFFKIN